MSGVSLRIGTWNLAGRWSARHHELLAKHACDVWLLTEVNVDVHLPGYQRHTSSALMAPRRHWAAVLSRHDATALTDPHPASAAVVVDGTVYCSSILPWRSCGDRPPWHESRHADKTAATVAELDAGLPQGPLVWGGDWNHALVGREYSGSIAGRQHVVDFLQRRRLSAPTATLPHPIAGLATIDHIAIAEGVPAVASRFAADGLSDHDGYLVDLT
jgi:hypothetical protein